MDHSTLAYDIWYSSVFCKGLILKIDDPDGFGVRRLAKYFWPKDSKSGIEMFLKASKGSGQSTLHFLIMKRTILSHFFEVTEQIMA